MSDDRRRMTDEEYDDWLRSIEEAAAEKKEVDLPPQPWGGRQRVQVLISDIQLYQAKDPEILIREMLAHYRFDLSAPIKRIPVADQDATMFYGWLKEDDDDRDDDGFYPSKIGGTISRSDLYEMLTRSGMLGTDTFPRTDFLNEFEHYPWASDKDSHHRRSTRKD